ncbi:MAG: hypothetical protein WCO78_02830 [Candidatus Roizmanbacteria bacterium]
MNETTFNIAEYLKTVHATGEDSQKMTSLIEDVGDTVANSASEKKPTIEVEAELVPLAQKLARDAGDNIVAVAINNQQAWINTLDTLSRRPEYKDVPEALAAINALKKTLATSMLPDQFKSMIAKTPERDNGENGKEQLQKIVKSARELAMVRLMQMCDAGEMESPISRDKITWALNEQLQIVSRDISASAIHPTLAKDIALSPDQSYLSDAFILPQIQMFRYATVVMVREYLRGKPVTTKATYYNYGIQDIDVINKPPENMESGQKRVIATGIQRYIGQHLFHLVDRLSGGDLSSEEARLKFFPSARRLQDHTNALLSQLFIGFTGEDQTREKTLQLKTGREDIGDPAKLQMESFNMGRALRAINARNSSDFFMVLSVLSPPTQDVIKGVIISEIAAVPPGVDKARQKEALADLLVMGWGVESLKDLSEKDKKELGLDENDVSGKNNKIAEFKNKITESSERARKGAVAEIGRVISAINRDNTIISNDSNRDLLFAQHIKDGYANIDEAFDMGDRIVFDEVSKGIVEKAFARVPPSEWGKLQADITRGIAEIKQIRWSGEDDANSLDKIYGRLPDDLSRAAANTVFMIAFTRDISRQYKIYNTIRRPEVTDRSKRNLSAYISAGKERSIDTVDMLAIHSSYLRGQTEMTQKMRKVYPLRKDISEPAITDLLADTAGSQHDLQINKQATWKTNGGENIAYKDPAQFAIQRGVPVWERKNTQDATQRIQWMGIEAIKQQTDDLVTLIDTAQGIRIAKAYDQDKQKLTKELVDGAIRNSRDEITNYTIQSKFDRLSSFTLKIDRAQTIPPYLRKNLTYVMRNDSALDQWGADKELTPNGKAAKEVKKDGLFRTTVTESAKDARRYMSASLTDAANRILQLKGVEQSQDPITDAGLAGLSIETYGGCKAVKERVEKAKDEYLQMRRKMLLDIIGKYTEAIKTPDQLSQILLAEIFNISSKDGDVDAQISDVFSDKKKFGVHILGTRIYIDSKVHAYAELKGVTIQKAMIVCRDIVQKYQESLKIAKNEVVEIFRDSTLNEEHYTKAVEAFDAKLKSTDEALRLVVEKLIKLIDMSVEKSTAGTQPPSIESVLETSHLSEHLTQLIKIHQVIQ